MAIPIAKALGGGTARRARGSQVIKKAAKKVLKRAAVRAKAYLRQLEEEERQEAQERESQAQDGFAYGPLNAAFIKLLKEGGAGFRPNYTWGVLHGVHLAKALGMDHISVIEFGVAGGNGLVSLERIAEKVEAACAVKIDVFGFDTGAGLPKPLDYRDLPNLYTERDFAMDFEEMKGRLRKAQLILGLVARTVPGFIHSRPAPVAFISFDLDYYTSTMQAFQLLDSDPALLLPRIHCYFDDIMGFTCSEYNGERLAIAEFNEAHATRKISPIFGLKYFLPAPHAQACWSELFYLAHIFDHPLYGLHDGLVRNPSAGGTRLRNA